jgi:acyl-CoA thioester hydrolase
MSYPVPAALADYPFVYWEAIRFRDLDMLAHVNNAVYATYFESARLAYYQQLTGKALEQVDLILAELTITYRAPAVFGDQLAIGVRVASIGTKSFVMEYAIYRGGSEDLIASGRSVMVTYDYAAGKSVPVPDAFRAAVGMGNG